MSKAIKAGLVMVTKFVKNDSKEFASYIDYMDRHEAIRNAHYREYVTDKLFNQNQVGSDQYIEYMGNPEKTTGLFTRESDHLSSEEKENLKEAFSKAQENGSLMWQTIFSFDNNWLEKNGIYLTDSQELNEQKVKSYVRKAMGQMLKIEKLDLALWSGSIHFNTDNIHVHIATVESNPTRETIKEGPYKGEYKGYWSAKTLRAGKSTLANQIIAERGFNKEINQLFRDTILKDTKGNRISLDPEFNHKFLQIYSHLPEDRRQWKYGNRVIVNTRNEINSLIDLYVNKYHPDEFKEFQQYLIKQNKVYKEIYGETNLKKDFYQSKMEDFYSRMGNAVLKHCKLYDQDRKYISHMRSPQKRPKQSSKQLSFAMNRLMRDMQSEVAKSAKNQYIYEKELEYQERLQKYREDQMERE